MFVPEPYFIAKLFSKYLYYKKEYMLNYITDKAVGEYTKALGEITDKAEYDKWVDEKLENAEGIEEYKIIFSILLDCDKRVAAGPLIYWGCDNNLALDDYLALAIGKKRWNETKLTIGSCPFQNIRGIVLNKKEYNRYIFAELMLSETELFTQGKLCVAASHADKESLLKATSSKELSFKNIGITASVDNKAVQKSVIDKSIEKAGQAKAKILILPELSVSGNELAYLKDKLNNSRELQLVVGGSYYKQNGNTFENLAPIYVNTEGGWKRIDDYAKMIPFSMSYTEKTALALGIDTTKYPPDNYKLLTEDISMDNSITLLPYKDCIIGVAICRDVMDLLNSHNPLHKYCDFVDIMLVISENRGDSNMFVGTAECLARWHNCATIYTNSIGSSDPNPDSHLEISFAIYPYKGTDVSSSTAVSGEITYEKKPFEKKKANGEDVVGILDSPGINYTDFTPDEIANCCKVYTIKEAKYT